MTGVQRECQFFLTDVTESIVVAVFEEVSGGVAGVVILIVVAVMTNNFQGIADAVVVAVRILDCDQVCAAARDGETCPKVAWHIALAVFVVSPASNDSIAPQCDRVGAPARYA
jgi:hypothetical protein